MSWHRLVGADIDNPATGQPFEPNPADAPDDLPGEARKLAALGLSGAVLGCFALDLITGGSAGHVLHDALERATLPSGGCFVDASGTDATCFSIEGPIFHVHAEPGATIHRASIIPAHGISDLQDSEVYLDLQLTEGADTYSLGIGVNSDSTLVGHMVWQAQHDPFAQQAIQGDTCFEEHLSGPPMAITQTACIGEYGASVEAISSTFSAGGSSSVTVGQSHVDDDGNTNAQLQVGGSGPSVDVQVRP